VRTRVYAFVAVGTVLLAAAVTPSTVLPALAVSAGLLPAPRPVAKPPAAPRPVAPPVREGTAGAAQLLARAGECDQISNGLYRTRDSTPRTVAVCDMKGAVFWKADMDIDCDGRLTARCNHETDPYFQEQTAYSQSDGKPLNAEKLPYIVVPTASSIWDHTSSGIRGGSVAAVIHANKVQYAVVGDSGPSGIIGEASYATAHALGIPTDPAGGGAASGVTYIVFKDSRVTPIEDHDAAVRLGNQLAKKFLKEN
jgi:hypothetical protein